MTHSNVCPLSGNDVFFDSWNELYCSICHAEQFGDLVLQDHNMKNEVGPWYDCISICGSGHWQPHLPCQDDNGLPTHFL
jgi:hypothetical protein